jgi:LuxR family maltose regulon positive regulatory protein
MPKPALFTLKWSGEHHLYELYEQDRLLLQANSESWFTWLTTHTSFSFRGKESRFNLLKETRKNKGEGYWYAYQRQGQRVIKRYVGRSAELTMTRLEEVERELQGALPSSPLLEPKFHLPRLHTSLVLRERLLTLLDTSLERRLTLLSAPAGSGKTTLVIQWIAERRAHRHFPPVAWLSLEKSDNDPVRFWRYVITACEIFQADLGRAALTQLATTPQFPLETAFLETMLTTFLNDLTRSVRRGVLVMEDYHVITSPQIHKTIAFLLDHLPDSLHLIIMTRSDPILPLLRLRVRGELCEVDAHALRFSQEEMAAFLQQLSPSVF